MRALRRWVVAGLVFVALSAARRARAGDDQLPARLSLGEALRLLRVRGLDLLIADAEVAAADADVKTARAIPNPQVTVGGGRSFTYDASRCAGCSDLSWSAGLSDEGAVAESLAGRRALRGAIAQAALVAARYGRTDALRQLDFVVGQQFVVVARQQATLEVLREEGAVWQELLELTRARLRAGSISEADVAKAETAALSSAQAVSSAQQDLVGARAALAYLLGFRGGLPAFEVESTVLSFAPSQRLLAMSPATLLALARDQRPDLKAAAAQVTAAEGVLVLARRLRVPAVTLSLQAAGQGTGQQAIAPPTLSLVAEITPPLLYQYQGEIGHAEAALTQQRLAQQKVEAQVASDIAVAQATYAATSERVTRMRTALLASAQRARDIVRVQYQKGSASFLDYLDAQRTYLDTRRDAVADAADHAIALFQIRQAIGQEPPR